MPTDLQPQAVDNIRAEMARIEHKLNTQLFKKWNTKESKDGRKLLLEAQQAHKDAEAVHHKLAEKAGTAGLDAEAKEKAQKEADAFLASLRQYENLVRGKKPDAFDEYNPGSYKATDDDDKTMSRLAQNKKLDWTLVMDQYERTDKKYFNMWEDFAYAIYDLINTLASDGIISKALLYPLAAIAAPIVGYSVQGVGMIAIGLTGQAYSPKDNDSFSRAQGIYAWGKAMTVQKPGGYNWFQELTYGPLNLMTLGYVKYDSSRVRDGVVSISRGMEDTLAVTFRGFGEAFNYARYEDAMNQLRKIDNKVTNKQLKDQVEPESQVKLTGDPANPEPPNPSNASANVKPVTGDPANRATNPPDQSVVTASVKNIVEPNPAASLRTFPQTQDDRKTAATDYSVNPNESKVTVEITKLVTPAPIDSSNVSAEIKPATPPAPAPAPARGGAFGALRTASPAKTEIRPI